MTKFIIIAAALAILGGIAWPLATSAFNGKPNEATRLVEATQRTNKKADNLNESFTDIIPPAPRREIPQHPPTSSMPPPGAMAPGAGAAGGEAPGQTAPEGIKPTATPGPLRAPQRARREGGNGVPQPAPDRDGAHANRVHHGSRAVAEGLDTPIRTGCGRVQEVCGGR